MAHGAIFISYRREDAPGYAGRLYDTLAATYGEERVFMDIGGIDYGEDFAERIDDALASCDVLLAVIGPEWLTVVGRDGRRRLDDPGDFIGLEIGTALRRPDVKVIPILVDGAKMPVEQELPPALTLLSRRQALDLSDRRWRYDVDTLVTTLDRAFTRAGRGPEPRERIRRTGLADHGRELPVWQPAVTAAIAAAVATWPAYAVYQAGLHMSQDTTAQQVARLSAAWAGFWAVVAAVVALATAVVARQRVGTVVGRTLIAVGAGVLAGALGGAVNGLLRYHWDRIHLGIVLGFLVTGTIIGATRIVRGAGLSGLVAGLLFGTCAGWLVTALDLKGRISQALPAVLVIAGIAAVAYLRGVGAARERGAPGPAAAN